METALNELPLAIFTTLAPMGAGAFVVLAAAFCTMKLDEAKTKAIDRFSLIPLGLIAVGFIASFFHLASPLKAYGVLSGIGHSPLSNEIAVGMVFFVAAIVYVALGLAGKLSASARKPFALVVAVLALVFSLFTGLAYMMPTIPSWDSPLVPLEMVGSALLGGALLALVVLALAKAFDGADGHVMKSVAFLAGVVGFVAVAVALVGHFDMLGELWSPAVAGASLAEVVLPFLWAAAACGVIGVACLGVASFGKGVLIPAGVGAIASLIGIFLVRFAFYAVWMSVGL